MSAAKLFQNLDVLYEQFMKQLCSPLHMADAVCPSIFQKSSVSLLLLVVDISW